MPASDPARLGGANQILSALDPESYERIAAALEPIALPIKSELIRPDAPVTHIHFPLSGVDSVVALMANGASVEAGVIGAEGAVGAHEVLAGTMSTNRCFTQVTGEAVRLAASTFLGEFERGGALQRAILRWTQALIVQISQTAACNRLHSVEQRLARWLLMCHDRATSDELALTHEFLSIMVATPRPGITKAIGRLTAPGCITHSRASIVITDREQLEGLACECYGIVQDASARSSTIRAE